MKGEKLAKEKEVKIATQVAGSLDYDFVEEEWSAFLVKCQRRRVLKAVPKGGETGWILLVRMLTK